MQAGEGIASTEYKVSSKKECFFCGKNHPDPKPAPKKFKTAGKPGWDRVSMAEKFDYSDKERVRVYASNKPEYDTEGHHCLAFSSFVKKNNDVFPRLNYYLNEVGFKPNDPKNIIQLPGRYPNKNFKSKFSIHTDPRYQNFFLAAKSGKPLQPHLGRHKDAYFAKSNALVQRLAIVHFDTKECEQKDLDTLKKKLKKRADAAVNVAFISVTSTEWKCHPEHLAEARKSYKELTGSPFPAWTKLKLPCTPF